MSVPIVEIGLAGIGIYLALGLAFSLAFHVAGLHRVDAATRGAGLFFRVLVTPGIIALWPLLAARWRAAAAGEPRFGSVHRPLSADALRALHRRTALALAVLVPFGAGLGLALRPAEPVSAHTAGGAGLIPEPLPLGRVLFSADDPFPGLPIGLDLRGDAVARQIELHVARDVGVPSLLLYWSDDVPGFARGGVLLGHVWGPGTRRYDLPQAASERDGALVLYAPLRAENLGSWPLPPAGAR